MAQKYVKIASFGKFKYDDSVTPNAIDTDGDVAEGNLPSFSAYIGADQLITNSNTFYPLAFDNVHFDEGSNFDPSIYTFITPSAGRYLVSYVVIWLDPTSQDRLSISLHKNGSQIKTNGTRAPASPGLEHISGSVILELNNNDTINMEAKNVDTGGSYIDGGPDASTLSVAKLK